MRVDVDNLGSRHNTTVPTSSNEAEVAAHLARAYLGNRESGKDKLASRAQLHVRARLARLLDPGSLVEDGLLANATAEGLPADGVITGVGRVNSRPVCVVANDSTVKAGSWGADRKSTRLNSSHVSESRMPSSA